ncbi:MAG: hypothetical protein EOM37_13295 [Proteobacteria bacterium]|nr:hypothetical protein [Pseudomonadota bacterium]
MLNIDFLLSKVDEARPTLPTSQTGENKSRSAVKQGMATVNPTLPTRPTEKTIVAKSNEGGAERPFSLEPLPGRYWLDPVDNGFMPSAKTMADLSECRGYPEACQRCRALMADLESCLLAPEGQEVSHV